MGLWRPARRSRPFSYPCEPRAGGNLCAALGHPTREAVGVLSSSAWALQTVKCPCVPIWCPGPSHYEAHAVSNSQSAKLYQPPQLHLHQNWLQRAISTSLIINEVLIYTPPKNKLRIQFGL